MRTSSSVLRPISALSTSPRYRYGTNSDTPVLASVSASTRASLRQYGLTKESSRRTSPAVDCPAVQLPPVSIRLKALGYCGFSPLRAFEREGSQRKRRGAPRNELTTAVHLRKRP